MSEKQMRLSSGFTIFELVLVISLIGILAALVSASLPGSKTKAQDGERDSDTKALSRHMETKYNRESSTSFPTYPGTATIASEVTALQNTGRSEVVKAPGSVSSSVTAAGATSDQTPAVTSYIYQPFTSTGTLCATPTSANPCVRYRIWYRHAATLQIKTVESLHQQ